MLSLAGLEKGGGRLLGWLGGWAAHRVPFAGLSRTCWLGRSLRTSKHTHACIQESARSCAIENSNAGKNSREKIPVNNYPPSPKRNTRIHTRTHLGYARSRPSMRSKAILSRIKHIHAHTLIVYLQSLLHENISKGWRSATRVSYLRL